jgi:hypothetical protein
MKNYKKNLVDKEMKRMAEVIYDLNRELYYLKQNNIILDKGQIINGGVDEFGIDYGIN